MRFAAIALVLTFACATHEARAQTTVSVAGGASKQDPGTNDPPRLGPPFGGTTFALLAAVDRRFFTPHITIGGEASLAGALTGDQSQRTATATNAFTSTHRDSVFSGVIKVGLSGDRRIHAAAAAGAGLAYRRTSREGTTAPLLPPSSRSAYSTVVSDGVFAYSLGGDVDVRVTDRVRIIAVARWHRLSGDDVDENGAVKRGVSSKIFRAGAGASWRF